MPVFAKDALVPVLITGLFVSPSVSAFGQSPNATQLANVVKAAAEIGATQRRLGADGANDAIAACYKQHLPSAKSLTRALEVCITQDILVSRMSAAFFRKISAEGRKKAGVPEPEVIEKSLTQRLLKIFKGIGMSIEEGRAFVQLVNTSGFEAYSKAYLVKSQPK